jgi:phosphatidylglycerophosphate synthase
MGVEPLVGPPREEGMAISISATSTVFDRELAVACAVQLAVLGVVSAAVGLSPLGWVAGLVFALVTGLLLVSHDAAGRARAAGAANQVTLARATLVGGVTALVAAGASGPQLVVLVAIGAVAIALDGLDGYLARRNNTVSVLGARFDMEVDAFLILALSGFVAPVAGPWVLAIGGARYAYVVAGWVLPWLRRPVPPRYWRKVVAATQGIVLTVAAAQLLPTVVADLALGAALALLTESFGRDVWWLWLQTRKPARRPIETARLAMAGTP